MPEKTNTLAAIPGLSRELVDALDALYPERCPDIMDSEREIWMYAGERRLVRKLRIILMQQENRDVSPDPRRLARL